MPRERVIASYLIRVTADERGTTVRLQDFRTGVTLEFETWVAAWSYVNEALEDGEPLGRSERGG